MASTDHGCPGAGGRAVRLCAGAPRGDGPPSWPAPMPSSPARWASAWPLPGRGHPLLNGLYDAKMDHMPVVALVGQQGPPPRSAATTSRKSTAHPVQGRFAYVETVVHPAQLRHVVDRAFRVAIAERQVATVIIPNDIQQLPAVESPPHQHANVLSGAGAIPHGPMPRKTTCRPPPTSSMPARRWPCWWAPGACRRAAR